MADNTYDIKYHGWGVVIYCEVCIIGVRLE